MAIFSQSGLRDLVSNFSPEERRDLARLRDEAAVAATATHLAEQDPVFHLCIGAPGSGHLHYVATASNDPQRNIVPVLIEGTAQKTLRYQNAFKRAIDDDGLPESEAHKEAVAAAANGEIWLKRNIANELQRDRVYNIAYPASPTSVSRGNLMKELMREPDALAIKIFFAPLQAMIKTEEGQQDGSATFEQFSATPHAIERILSIHPYNVELFWQKPGEEEPKVVARTDREGNFFMTDGFGWEELTKEARQIDPKFDFRELQHIALRTHHRLQASSKHKPGHESEDLVAAPS